MTKRKQNQQKREKFYTPPPPQTAPSLGNFLPLPLVLKPHSTSIHPNTCQPHALRCLPPSRHSSPNDDPLLAQPTLGGLALALQHHSVGLQPARHVVPRRGDKPVFAAEILDFLLEFGLLTHVLALRAHHAVHYCNDKAVKGNPSYRALLRALALGFLELFAD